MVPDGMKNTIRKGKRNSFKKKQNRCNEYRIKRLFPYENIILSVTQSVKSIKMLMMIRREMKEKKNERTYDKYTCKREWNFLVNGKLYLHGMLTV